MNVLILTGSCNSIWTRLFVEKTLSKIDCKIFIQKNPNESNEYDDFFSNIGVSNIFNYKTNRRIASIPFLGKYYSYYKRARSFTEIIDFDYIIVLSGNPLYIRLANKVAGKDTKIVTWFIGSDLLRANILTFMDLKILFNNKNLIPVFVTEKLKDIFNRKVCRKKETKVIDFGNSIIQKIFEMNIDRNACKKELKIPEASKTIAIGYNGSDFQQHSKVLKELVKIKQAIQDCCLILPMSYHGTKRYRNKIEKKLISYGFKYIIIDKFLSPDEMIRLWKATDILIHAQKTDAFSSSVLEAICCGCIVINGSWLVYKELDDFGITIDTFHSFSDIGNLVLKELNCERSDLTKTTKEKLIQYSSWINCLKKWKEVVAVGQEH